MKLNASFFKVCFIVSLCATAVTCKPPTRSGKQSADTNAVRVSNIYPDSNSALTKQAPKVGEKLDADKSLKAVTFHDPSDEHISSEKSFEYRFKCVLLRMLAKGTLATVSMVPFYQFSILVDLLFQYLRSATESGGQSALQAAQHLDDYRATFKEDIEKIQELMPTLLQKASVDYVRRMAIRMIDQLTDDYRLGYAYTATGINCIMDGLFKLSNNPTLNTLNSEINTFNSDISNLRNKLQYTACPLVCPTIDFSGGYSFPTIPNIPGIDTSVKNAAHVDPSLWFGELASLFVSDDLINEILNLAPNISFEPVDLGEDLVPLVQTKLVDDIVTPTSTKIEEYRFVSSVIFGFALAYIFWNTVQPLIKASIPQGKTRDFLTRTILPSLKLNRKLKPGFISRRGRARAVKQSSRNVVRIMLHDVLFRIQAFIVTALIAFKVLDGTTADAVEPAMEFADKVDNETDVLQGLLIGVGLDAFQNVYNGIAFSGEFLHLEKIEQYLNFIINDTLAGVEQKVLFDCSAADLLEGSVQFLTAAKITSVMEKLYDSFENFTTHLRTDFKPAPVTFARRSVTEAASARDKFFALNIMGPITISAIIALIGTFLKTYFAPLVPQPTLEYLDLMPNKLDDEFDEE